MSNAAHSHSHSHSHHHHHHHHAPSAGDMASGAFTAGIILNAGYVVAEAIAGLATHSMALLSDAGHNLGDVAGLVLSMLSFRLARSKPTETYTYGFKKTTILAALANAVILLVGIGVLGYESIRRFGNPQPIQGGVVAWVAAVGIIINGVSAMLFFRHKHELNSRAAYTHLFMDAMVSISVVIIGIIIHYTDYSWLDPAISLVVLAVILISTWRLLVDSIKLSMDAVPDGILVDEVVQIVKKVPGVEDIHHTHVWAMSTTENALTAHVVLNKMLGFEEKLKVVHNIKHELEHHNIKHATIEMESADTPCEDTDC